MIQNDRQKHTNKTNTLNKAFFFFFFHSCKFYTNYSSFHCHSSFPFLILLDYYPMKEFLAYSSFLRGHVSTEICPNNISWQQVMYIISSKVNFCDNMRPNVQKYSTFEAHCIIRFPYAGENQLTTQWDIIQCNHPIV